MTSAKLLRGNCQLFYFCNLGGLYVNEYCSDFIIYDLIDQTATYQVFDGDDVNATDWVVIEPFTYNHYE